MNRNDLRRLSLNLAFAAQAPLVSQLARTMLAANGTDASAVGTAERYAKDRDATRNEMKGAGNPWRPFIEKINARLDATREDF